MKETIYYHKYYFTKKDFIENFNIDLTKYLSEYVDLEVIDFKEFLRERYIYALEFLDFIIDADNYEEIPLLYVDLDLFWDLMSFFNLNDHKIESYRDFCTCINDKSFKYSLDIAFNPKFQYLKMSWNKILKMLEGDNEELNEVIKNSPSKGSLTLESKKTFDPNYFNSAGYELFSYLIENYTAKKEQKIKYINIYYYMLNEIPKNSALSSIYTFNFTQEKFKLYMVENYSIELKKMATAEFDFQVQIRVLNSLEMDFRSLYLKS